MTTKRINILAGTILGGALLLGTAGLAFAQDPTADPSPQTVPGMSGGAMSGGMMGGQGMNGAQMRAMHASMGQDGTCDPALVQSMHPQDKPTR